MATDAEVQKFVQRHHGFIPKTGWIAHVKQVHGIPTLREADRARHDRDVEPFLISFIYVDTCVSEVHHMRGYKW